MSVAKSIFKPIFKSYSRRAIAGSEGGIPGLLSLWNAKTPTVCPVGPQIQTSVAGNQPDASGNMVPWPVNHPGRGVMVQPAYSNLLQNSKFEGAVSGTPGAAPTNWAVVLTGGTLTVAGPLLTFSAAVAREGIGQSLSVFANTTYIYTVDAVCDGNLAVADIIYPVPLPSGATSTYYVDGVGQTVGYKPSSGSRVLAVKMVIAGTGGTVSFRFGAGTSGAATGTVTISNPQLVASPYQMPYAASGAGATTSVTSTASTSGGNGLAIPLSAAMIAALSGGAFTAAALVEMGVSSAQVTAPANILSVKDVAAGLIFADSGGKLKCTDGTNTAEVTVTGGWARTDELLPVVQCDGATFRTGYAKNTFTAITWGSAVAVGADGDWNVVTHERIGLNSVIPFGIQQTQFWGKSASEAEVLKVQGYAI